jgi:hypothetical protein
MALATSNFSMASIAFASGLTGETERAVTITGTLAPHHVDQMRNRIGLNLDELHQQLIARWLRTPPAKKYRQAIESGAAPDIVQQARSEAEHQLAEWLASARRHEAFERRHTLAEARAELQWHLESKLIPVEIAAGEIEGLESPNVEEKLRKLALAALVDQPSEALAPPIVG